MKRFIIKILTFAAVIVAILTFLIGARLISATSFSWKLPEGKHILFLGASHVARGIDDRRMESAYNWAKPSERYMFTYIKLSKILEAGSPVDTIFLECAPTDIWEHTDDKYLAANEGALYAPMYWPYFGTEEIRCYQGEYLQTIDLIASKLLSPSFYIHSKYKSLLGGYDPLRQEMDRDKVREDIQVGTSGHDINYKYLRRIIEVCNNKNIKLYLLYCPVYKPELSYDQDYYYSAYNKYFSDVELLDYSHLPMKDNERYDAHHLNQRGAEIFTDSLKRRFNIQ